MMVDEGWRRSEEKRREQMHVGRQRMKAVRIIDDSIIKVSESELGKTAHDRRDTRD